MALYENATDFYNASITTHTGDTYSHKYKSILEQIHTVIRKVLSYDIGSDEISPLKTDLVLLDAQRKTVESKLLALHPELMSTLQAVSGGDRSDIASRIGLFDSELGGVGSQMLFNLLGMPGSEASAVERTLDTV